MLILTLNTDGAVLADVKVEHVNLPLTGGPGKHRAGVRSPGHIPSWRGEVEGVERSLGLHVPDLHGPLRRTAQEDRGQEGVPLEGVDGSAVSLECSQDLRTRPFILPKSDEVCGC